MRSTLLLYTIVLSFISYAQLDRIKTIPLPSGLSEKSVLVEIFTAPNPDYGEIIEGQGSYEVKWSHQTYIVAHEKINIEELGAYLLYNGTWMLRQKFNKREIRQMFQTKSLELKKGDTLVYNDNVRFDKYSSTGWNFWYVKVRAQDGTSHSTLDYLETKGISKDGSILLPLTVDSSSLNWTGKAGDSDYELSGSVSSLEGALVIRKDSILGGYLQLDMASMEHENEQLIGHLKSKDFFDVANFPTATFFIKELHHLASNIYEVIGEMSLLGIIQEETTKIVLEENKDYYYLHIDMVLDRTKYGMTYASSLDTGSDYSISDSIYLTAKLGFRKDYPSSLPWNKTEKP